MKNIIPRSKIDFFYALVTVIAFANCVRLFDANSHVILAESFDTGWIVRTGEFVFHNGPPWHDIYSWTNPERRFVAYQWIFELICYLIHKAGGLWLLGLSACATAGILYLAVLPYIWRRLGIPFWVSFSILSLVLTSHWFNVRPQLVSYPLLLVLVLLLEKYRNGKTKLVWTIPFLMVIWANTHTFFAFGLGVLAIYAACRLLRYGARAAMELCAVLALSTGAALLNPYGLELPWYIFGFLNGDQFLGMKEAQSSLTDPSAQFVLAYFLICWTVLLRQRNKLSAEALIICTAITFAAISVRRYQSIGVLLTWPYFGIALAQSRSLQLLQGGLKRSPMPASFTQLPALLSLSTIVAIQSWCVGVASEAKAKDIYCEGNQEIIRFYAAHRITSDRLFNDPTTGSWLIYFGVTPVFIDTRYDMYPKDFTEQAVYCIRAGPRWNDYLSRQNVNQVLMRDDFTLITSALQKSEEWKLIVDNGRLSLWMRRSAKLPQRLESWKVSDELIRSSGLPSELVKETIQSRCRQYFARSELNLRLQKFDRAVEDLTAAVALLPESRFLRQKLDYARAASYEVSSEPRKHSPQRHAPHRKANLKTQAR